MTDRLALSVQEVADALGVSRDCIYRALTAGDIPSIKVGARVLIPRVWLEQLLQPPATPEAGLTLVDEATA
jgi:excisionase family DNA binding protein